MKVLKHFLFLFLGLTMLGVPTSLSAQAVAAPFFQWARDVSFGFNPSAGVGGIAPTVLELGAQCDVWVGKQSGSNAGFYGFVAHYSGSGTVVYDLRVPVVTMQTNPFVNSRVWDMEVDVNNNLYHVGNEATYLEPYAHYIEKLSPTGVSLWSSHHIRSPMEFSEGLAVEVKGNEVYEAGHFHQTILFSNTDSLNTPLPNQDANYLVKYDSLGALQWRRQFPYTDNITEVIANNGFVYVVGAFSNVLTIDANTVTAVGGKDIYIAKFNAIGTCVQLVRAGGISDDFAKDMELKSNGDLALAGILYGSGNIGTIALNAPCIFSATYSNNLTVLSANSLLPSASFDSTEQGLVAKKIQIDENSYTYVSAADLSLYKFKPTGSVLWHKVNYGNNYNTVMQTNDFRPRTVAISSNGSLSVAGNYYPIYDLQIDATIIPPTFGSTGNYYDYAFLATYYDNVLPCSPNYGVALNVDFTTSTYCSDAHFTPVNIVGTATTYSWYVGTGTNQTLFSTAPSPTHSFNGFQQYFNITLIASNGTVSDTVSNYMVLNDVMPIPVILLSDTIPCTSVTLNVNATSGANGNLYDIYWSDGSTPPAIVGPGTYSVTLYDPVTSCTITSDLITIQLDLPATISTPLCATSTNNSACITVSGGVAPYSYLWSDGGTSNCNNSLVAGNNYTITATDVNGCTFTANNVDIPYPLATTTTHTNVNGATLGTATANPSGGTPPYSYSWSNNGTTQQIANLAVGTYTVFVTDANNCQNSQSVTISNQTALEAAVNNGIFGLYPNPNKGNFVLKSFANKNYEANVSILDATGRTIYTQQLSLNALAETSFHLGISEGMYLLKVETSEGVFYQKFVTEK